MGQAQFGTSFCNAEEERSRRRGARKRRRFEMAECRRATCSYGVGCPTLVVGDILPLPAGGSGHPSAAEGQDQSFFYGAVERGGHRFGMAHGFRDLVLLRYPI